MSKVLKYNNVEIFQDRREKIVKLLLSEILFLKQQSKKHQIENKYPIINIALNKLDYLLNILIKKETDLTEAEFNKMILLVHDIIQDIASYLE